MNIIIEKDAAAYIKKHSTEKAVIIFVKSVRSG